MKTLSFDRASYLLTYNEYTGEIRWKNKPCKNRPQYVGKVAGTINNVNGYMQIKIDGELYLAHRVAWLLNNKEMPNDQIDHLNHCRLDNRVENLRVVDYAENARNQTTPSNCTSGCIGVTQRGDSWKVSITVNGKRIGLGTHKDKADAIAARKSAERKYGFHKNHGK